MLVGLCVSSKGPRNVLNSPPIPSGNEREPSGVPPQSQPGLYSPEEEIRAAREIPPHISHHAIRPPLVSSTIGMLAVVPCASPPTWMPPSCHSARAAGAVVTRAIVTTARTNRERDIGGLRRDRISSDALRVRPTGARSIELEMGRGLELAEEAQV